MSSLTIGTEELLQHAAWVRALAQQLVGDPHRAEDLAQDAMVTALRHPPRRTTSLRNWLAIVVRNRARSERRTEARRRAREQRAATGESLPSTSELVERLSIHRDVVDRVQQLAEPYRTTVLLRFFEQRSLHEIAQHYGIPRSTVTTRIRRAIEMLRIEMDRAHGGRKAWSAALAPMLAFPRDTAPPAVAAHTRWLFAATAALTGTAALWLTFGGASDAEPGPIPGPGASSPTATSQEAAVATTRLPADPPAHEAPARYATAGRVVDVLGATLAGVEVGFVPHSPEDSFPRARMQPDGPAMAIRDRRSEVTAKTTTGPDGRFELPATHRNGRLIVTGDDWATVLAGVRFDEETVEPIVVAAPSAELRGIVHGPHGGRIAGAIAEIELPAALRSRIGLNLDRSVVVGWRIASDDEGGFAIPRVPMVPGASVTVRRTGYATVRRALTDAVLGVGTYQLQLDGDSDPGALRGRVVDASGVAIPAVPIVLGDTHLTETDSSGSFSYPRHLVSVATRVTAVVPGFAPAVEKLGPESSDLVLRIEEPAPRISGRVIDAAGHPVAGAWVWFANPTLFADDVGSTLVSEAMIANVGSSWYIEQTDGAGRFDLLCTARTDYVLRASRAGCARFGSTGPVAAGATDVELRYPTDEAFPRLAGRVLDRTGAPVAGVLVSASRDALMIPLSGGRGTAWKASGPATYTAADGRFELIDVTRAAGLFVNSEEVFERTLPPEGWSDPEDIEIVVSRVCHVQVESTDPTHSGELAFAVLDVHGKPVEIRLGLGIAVKPMQRCAMPEGRSPVVAVPDEADTVILYDGQREVARTRARFTPAQTTRVRL